MMMPTQEFLDLLVGYIHDSGSRRRRLTVKQEHEQQQQQHDVEHGVSHPTLAAAPSLLEGVTAEWETALHVLATHGDSTGFLECASTILARDKGLLYAVNKKGDTPLHSAARAVITEVILKWNVRLTTHGDRDGSTPLHVASSLPHSKRFRQLFEANPTPVYQADNDGLFPIHVAANVGATHIVRIILGKFPSSAGLRTAQGHTFLHVAIKHFKLEIVFFVCRTPSLGWILNMQDNDGNTAMHLAVQSGSLRMFCSLYANKEVHLSLENKNKQTPLDKSRSLLQHGMDYGWNSEQRIYKALKAVGAKHSNLRRDQVDNNYISQIKRNDLIELRENMKDSSQLLGISSVLITTVAFGATFALPGGYRADDHTNGGTPTLAGSYTFDAFIMANTLAFLCSSIATLGLMFSGTSMVNLLVRGISLSISVFLLSSSVTSLSAAFALAVYMVLAPVAHPTAIAVCVLSPLIVLCRHFEAIAKLFILGKPLYLRMGLVRTICLFLNWFVVTMFVEFWPLIIIFGWATIARKLRDH